MIISDLNYLETAIETEVVGGGSLKDFNLKTSVEADYDFDVDIDADKDIDSDINSNVDIKGNAGILAFDNTALGPNTYAEANVANTVVKGVGSEQNGLLTAAAL